MGTRIADNKDNSDAAMARQILTRVVRFIDANQKVMMVGLKSRKIYLF